MIEIKDSFQETINKHGDFYFKDLNVNIHILDGVTKVIDLTNALKVGKTCKEYVIQNVNYHDSLSCNYFNTIHKLKITEKEFIINLIAEKYNNIEFEKITIRIREIKAINVFSPFVKIKPIKLPKNNRFTVPNIWKAILSGQIVKITKEMYLTDDYRSDASDNFNKGRDIGLFEMAKELIENKGGYWFNIKKETDKEILIGINCHQFDYNLATFKK